MKVSLFVTCLSDIFYTEVGKDVVEVLERLGCEIDFPRQQTCCGQPAYNSGYHKETREVAKNMIKAFEHADYVVSPSGSCAAMLHEYPHLFKDDHEWKEKAEKLANKTFEFTQFIVDVLKVEDVGAKLPVKATYHTSCHMTRLLGVKDAPMTLLQNVDGLEFTSLPNKENCCGFGGTFSVKMVPISEQMVNEKVAHVESTKAEVLIGADCGCLMNIGGRIDRQGKPIKTMHIAQVLNSR
ncbi:Fe-S oxidoreductase [Alkalihalobacillus alcalophilus ATCC 27647 = CGMCC 1.3604]|uniref:Lactate utilization protein A n=1 Tax=Alkalihalobacillus alcalophilus ATCC 27647 = CGMCC 1.3604 TaxID=1218173 RepID=A0A094WPS4_ALKAL|nr:(Fe-S)-binding protein [Alkalihalobacillus alcalophilus]KGA98033.1 Fe-S oxidoreductase [Alkalihalobacillus alcalophilus ATCC 27647 = CGMCC 1.3604]MED1561843.1 (Fe-S)-binding protein [Alkalihalobacillus alcalophilus]THG88496.1 Fe-S oxidoreductase [Alkalihalobacillus alcalophilus ATCC 27647 = CGMCC 1.3604]